MFVTQCPKVGSTPTPTPDSYGVTKRHTHSIAYRHAKSDTEATPDAAIFAPRCGKETVIGD